MKCQDMQNKLELYVDNELSVQEKAEIEAHLSTCAVCAGQVANLKTLDSLGKREIFREPSLFYWKELKQNIMNEIKAPDKKSFNLAALLQRLKNYIFPPKLSFRLAGLVATAVIVFFIIHISFIRQGKFELPQKIETQDSISISEQETQSIEIKNDKAPGAPRRADAPETPNVTSIQLDVNEQLSDRGSEPPPIINIEVREIGKLPEPSQLLEHQYNIEAEEIVEQRDRAKSISDGTVPSQKEARRVTEKPAYMSLEKKGVAEKDAFRVQSVGASKSTSLPDTSIVRFDITRRKVLAVTELTEKIKIWEDYIQTQPEFDLLRKAKYEQAQLYFRQAQNKKKESQVKQIIKFYYDNFELLAAVADSAQIEKQLDVLQQLLNESRKK